MTNEGATYQRPWLYDKQRDAIFCDERYAIVEASTKSGKTVGCIIWLTEQAMMGKSGQNFWWVAPIFGQAKIAFRRLIRSLPRHVYKINYSEMTVTLANGSIIWFKGADNGDSLYGEDVHAAVIDEATRCKVESWYAVRSTLTATSGPIRIIGNVKGRKNWAYQIARRAQAGEPGMHYARITAHDAAEANVISFNEIADAKANLPATVFKELYLAEPSDDAANPFGIDAIQKCIGTLSQESAAVWGIDLAKSSDYTVAIALDDQGRVCRLERWQGPWEDTINKIIGLTGRALALIDSTGVGDPVLESLQKRGRDHGARYEGFKFSSTSKQQLMEGLAVAIQQRQITFPDGVIVNELDAFEFEYTRTGVRYTAPAGLHDDAVCALALAVSALNSMHKHTLRIWGGDDTAVDEAATLVAAESAVLDAMNSDHWFNR